MYRLLIVLGLAVYVVSCSPKLASTGDTKDYIEDVSAFRPSVPHAENGEIENGNIGVEKGPYVAPTHDINNEMSIIMDSIIAHNRDKTYITYTIQVYIGRSREEANQIREKVYNVMPEEKPQLVYKQPSYKVTVGKYYDRIVAYKTLNKLRVSFPGAGLVRERNFMH